MPNTQQGNMPQTSARQVTGHLSDTSSVIMSDWVSVQKAAALCNVSERTITRWIKDGRLLTTKRGPRRLVCRTSISKLPMFVRQCHSQDKACDTQNNPYQATIESSLKDITELVCAMVELYHPGTLSDITRKRTLSDEVDRICASHRKGGAHD